MAHKIGISATGQNDGPTMNSPSVKSCVHGGAFFEAVGDTFATLERSTDVINADVLDAWFPPSPQVVDTLQEYLPWLLRTSPPTHCEGMVRTIAQTRGLNFDCILPAAGSSTLIFLAFQHWLRPTSRVLVLDPSYGEYSHVLEHVIGCRVDRYILSRSNDYRVDLDEFEKRLEGGYDLVIIVNPNSPTGQHVPRADFEYLLRHVPKTTRVWLDEAYVEYVGSEESLESFAVTTDNVVVCKSMSKVYALSGVRAAYLCGSSRIITELTVLTPPWAVSLLGQVAVVKALQDPEYYFKRYEETRRLREMLTLGLQRICPMKIIPSTANFVLCHLPEQLPPAQVVVEKCKHHGLFLRDASQMGSDFGDRAIRFAVKDATTIGRMLEIFAHALT